MHKESVRSLQKLQKDFDKDKHVQGVLKALQKEIKEIEEWKPTIEALCNKALQPRHWSKIKEVAGMSENGINFETAALFDVL